MIEAQATLQVEAAMNVGCQHSRVGTRHEPCQTYISRLTAGSWPTRRLSAEPARCRQHVCKRRKLETGGHSLRCSANSPQTASTSSDRSSGRDTYQPSSYRELVGDAAAAVATALEAGETRLEVEFPPTPGGVNSALHPSAQQSKAKSLPPSRMKTNKQMHVT